MRELAYQQDVVLVPVTRDLAATLGRGWSKPVELRMEVRDGGLLGDLIFRTLTEADLAARQAAAEDEL